MTYNAYVFDIETFVKTFSYLGIFGIVFAESGLLIGLVFPGDSLLFLAGALAAQNFMNIGGLIAVVVVAAILGNATGYWIGSRYGLGFLKRSKILSADQLKKAQDFFAKHGGKTITLSRFVPVVRTLAPLLAGIGDMSFAQFSLYNVAGAVAWGGGVTLLGYYIGSAIPNIDNYILPIVIAVVVLSAAPSAWHLWRRRKS